MGDICYNSVCLLEQLLHALKPYFPGSGWMLLTNGKERFIFFPFADVHKLLLLLQSSVLSQTWKLFSVLFFSPTGKGSNRAVWCAPGTPYTHFSTSGTLKKITATEIGFNIWDNLPSEYETLWIGQKALHCQPSMFRQTGMSGSQLIQALSPTKP